MSNRYDDIISDIYKDAYGHRPSATWCEAFGNLSDTEQFETVVQLQKIIDESIDDDFADDLAAIQDYEKAIANLILTGAKNRETAIRWILDALNVQDADTACYELGLPYYSSRACLSGFAHEFDFYFEKGN